MQKLRGLLSKQSSPLPSSKDQRSGVGEDPALTSSMRVQSHALNPTRDIVKIVQRTNDSKEVIELNNGLDKIYIPLLVIAQLWLDACKRRAKHILHTEVLCPLIKIFTIISETHSTKYIAHHHLRSVSFSGMIRSYRLSHRFSWTPRSTKTGPRLHLYKSSIFMNIPQCRSQGYKRGLRPASERSRHLVCLGQSSRIRFSAQKRNKPPEILLSSCMVSSARNRTTEVLAKFLHVTSNGRSSLWICGIMATLSITTNITIPSWPKTWRNSSISTIWPSVS